VGNLEEMIVVVDRDYRYVTANQAYLDYRGANPEQIIGHPSSEIVAAEVFETTFKRIWTNAFRVTWLSSKSSTTLRV
jgi:PAS domain-containing protein